MRARLLNDPSAQEFSEQLLDMGNGKLQINNTNGFITFPKYSCKMLQSQEELIQRVFPETVQHYKNYDWLRGQAKLEFTCE